MCVASLRVHLTGLGQAVLTVTIHVQDGSSIDSATFPDNTYVLHWDSFAVVHDPRVVSIPRLVFDNHRCLLQKYNQILDDIGEQIVGGREFKPLKLRQDLNYWWMSIPAVYSLQRDSPVFVALKLLALELFFEDRCHSSVQRAFLDGGSDQQRSIIISWLRHKGISVSPSGDTPPHRVLRGLQQIRCVLSAFRVWIDYVLAGLTAGKNANVESAGRSITVIDYLSNQSFSSSLSFSSPWLTISKALEGHAKQIRWLHISAKYANLQTLERDRETLRNLSANLPGHSLLHNYASVRTAWHAFIDYLRVCRTRSNIKSVLSTYSIGPAFSSAVNDLFLGRTTMLNCLWITLFEEALRKDCDNALCLYLYENQPWEAALLSGWRRKTNAPVAGVGATTMLTWDTRYNKFWSTELMSSSSGPPQPDLVLVNGPLMRQQIRSFGFPDNKIRDVEPLGSKNRASSSGSEFDGEGAKVADTVDVFLLGEYEHPVDQSMIQLLHRFQEQSERGLRFTYRPHPANRTTRMDLPPNWQRSQHSSIESALRTAHVTVSGPISSAALDAYSLGLPVIVIADPASPLASPVTDLPNVHIAFDYNNLQQILTDLLEQEKAGDFALQAFHQSGVTRWEHLFTELFNQPVRKSESR